MKKIILILGLFFSLLTIINVLIYREFADYDTFDFGPVIPVEDPKSSRLIAALYKNDSGEQLIIQRYYWQEEFKFIYYSPTTVSDDFVVSSFGNKKILGEGEELYAIDSNVIKPIGDDNDFLNLNYIPQKLKIKKSSAEDIFHLDSILKDNVHQSPTLNFWNKLTIGPILRINEL